MGDFTGFKFDDWHSDNCDIIRVSGSDRYNETIHPEINNKTVEVPGMDGGYYYGSDYGPRQFEIEIAFDHLTEEQFRELRQTFGTKEMKKLVFDERPYKYYMAKLASPIELSYICFDEREKQRVSMTDGDKTYGVRRDSITRKLIPVEPYEFLNDTKRIYKGEGKISLIAYFPFAKSEYKTLPVNGSVYYTKSSLIIPYERVEDWASSSGILSTSEYNNRDKFVTIGDGKGFKVYNPGDLPTGFRLYCSFGKATSLTIKYYKDCNQSGGNNYDAILVIDTMTPQGSSSNVDKGIIIDTNLELIYGVSQDPSTITSTTSVTNIKTSSYIYNQYVASGTFFKIEPHKDTADYSNIIIETNGSVSGVTSNIQIFYDYLYF